MDNSRHCGRVIKSAVIITEHDGHGCGSIPTSASLLCSCKQKVSTRQQ